MEENKVGQTDEVLIVDDDKLARKGLVAIMDWESMDSR